MQPSGVRLQITSQSEAFGGAAFGSAGPYEHIRAVAHMTIDPLAPANRGIVDLGHAPRDATGMVRYDIDIEILRPRDPLKARRVLFYDVVNRGIKIVSMMMGLPTAGDGGAGGDAFFMRQGYILVWSGWQGDLPGAPCIGARFPVAADSGQPITGRIAPETVFDDLTTNRIALPYAAASLDQTTAFLTVRQRQDDAPEPVPAAAWHYDGDRHIVLQRPANMDAGAIYRVSYMARDPKVMGLGFASVRDLIAFLRHGTAAQGNPLADIAAAPCERDAAGACVNPEGGAFSVAVAFGISQSGRFLRDFLWQDFNRDLNGQRVFDGMIALIPGARRTYTNMRFSEPSLFSRQHEDHGVPGFDFPFAYGTIRDPVTGKTDGILARCIDDLTCPKVFQIDTSGEFWQAGASLVGTGGTDHDIPFPGPVRAYMIAGGSHATGMTAPACRFPPNMLNYMPVIRALIVGMVDWASARQDPPASRWPRVERGQLRLPEALEPPDLGATGITWPHVYNAPVPPAGTSGWPVLVPIVDADGNDVPGIRLPALAAPAGTYLGWNLRQEGYAPAELCSVFGSYIAFTKTAAARGKDPRPSLQERYQGDGRLVTLRAAAAALVQERLLLTDDAESLSSEG